MIFLGFFFFFAGIKDPQIPSLPGTRRGSSAASFPLKSLGREKALPVRPSLNRCFHARESESRGKIQWMFPDQSHPFFSRSLSSVSSWSASSPLGRLMWLLKGSFGKKFQKSHFKERFLPSFPDLSGIQGSDLRLRGPEVQDRALLSHKEGFPLVLGWKNSSKIPFEGKAKP